MITIELLQENTTESMEKQQTHSIYRNPPWGLEGMAEWSGKRLGHS